MTIFGDSEQEAVDSLIKNASLHKKKCERTSNWRSLFMGNLLKIQMSKH